MTCTPASMDALRLVGDELADATVEALFSRGEVGTFNTLMRYFSTVGQELPDGLPEPAREYLHVTGVPPEWVDWEVMDQARLFFVHNDVHISTALSFASMPACYAVPHVARLLSATHSLDYPNRRMAETGQFTVYLMQPDAFEAGSRFVPAAQKVRLLHAAVRHHLLREDRWDIARWGTPICQEDMIGGQMLFSLLVLDSLHRLNIHMTAEGAEAYFYAWRVVGAMLGVDQTHAPTGLAAARAFLDLYLTRYMGPSDEGAHLTRQLIKMYEQVVPGTLLDPLVSALIRYLIGDTCADWLQVPCTGWDIAVRAVPAVLGALETMEDRSPLATWLLEALGHLVTRFELTSLTRGRIMHYAIPEHLKPDYGVAPTVPETEIWTPPPCSVRAF
ncbi:MULTISPECIES: oxygenase MpaB family protein [Streptomyces]|uniref:oxygenase MpaB family protein n=1 Tax=Streptomyces TaxID=1883 RepID=UPI001367BCA6|nr:oxygenase MpaB family protein [Streptomyces sp. SID2888]MYV46043.1 DUF2236 domain-containing protein [Streptomyces sp. SID2888]